MIPQSPRTIQNRWDVELGRISSLDGFSAHLQAPVASCKAIHRRVQSHSNDQPLSEPRSMAYATSYFSELEASVSLLTKMVNVGVRMR